MDNTAGVGEIMVRRSEIFRTLRMDPSTITFELWIKAGGCGLSAWASYYASKALSLPESQWREKSLAEIMATSDLARREIERFTRENRIELLRKECHERP